MAHVFFCCLSFDSGPTPRVLFQGLGFRTQVLPLGFRVLGFRVFITFFGIFRHFSHVFHVGSSHVGSGHVGNSLEVFVRIVVILAQAILAQAILAQAMLAQAILAQA